VSSTEGSVREWDDNWRRLASHQQQLYRQGAPQTIVQFWQQCYFEDIWAALEDRAPSAKYVELGSGRGTTSMYLVSRDCDVTLIDLSAAAFRLAAENFRRERLKMPVLVTADARRTGLPAASFDCVFNIGVLEHFEDPRPVLTEAMRLLAPGGLLFMVVVPARSDRIKWLARLLLCPWRLGAHMLSRLAYAVRKPDRAGAADPVYRTAYTRREYRNWLVECGAADVACVPYNPYHSVYRRDALNQRIALPLYRLHHAVMRALGRVPRLKTFASVAICELLTARKPLVS
jgi:SAM-dependent methyltransferase